MKQCNYLLKLVTLSLLFFMNGCSNGSSTTVQGAPIVKSIKIVSTSSKANVGVVTKFTAIATYSNTTTADITALATWSSSSTNVVNIDGSVVAISAGTTNIVATYESTVSNVVAFTVNQARLSSITISTSSTSTSSTISVPTLGSQQFIATGTYDDKTTANITSAVTWSSSNPLVATITNGINGGGFATASYIISSTIISATLNSISDSVTLNTNIADHYVYISNNNVFELSINPNGLLNLFMPIVSFGSPISGIALSSSKLYGYIIFTQHMVFEYSIDQMNGQLAPLEEASIDVGSRLSGIVLSSSGKYAYITNQNNQPDVVGSVYEFSIDQTTGQLVPLPEESIATGLMPSGIVLSPSGKYAYITNQNNQGGIGSVYEYSIDQTTGQLVPLLEESIATGLIPSGIVLSTSGLYAYVTNSGSEQFLVGEPDSISEYSINPITGQLSPLATITVASMSNLSSIVISSSGKYCYAIGSTKGIYEYSISNKGKLVPLAPNVIVVRNGDLMGITLSPSGLYAYVVSTSAVYEYSINQRTGQLTPLSTPYLFIGSEQNPGIISW